MKKKFLLVALLASIFSVLCALPAAAASVVSSTNAAVVWPNYKAKPWGLDREAPMVAMLLYMPKGNSYVLQPGIFSVRIGTASWYFDNGDMNSANAAVVEVNVLGNGPVLRRMMTREIENVDTQVMLKGKWVSLPPRSQLQFEVNDEDSVILKNQMSGVTLTVLSEDGKVLLQLKLDNKEKKK